MTVTNGRQPARRRKPRPYRDSALLYAVFGVIVIVLAVVTGGEVLWAIVGAIGAFLLATGWTWRNLRNRERSRQ
jgi:drug/metabolite transporter (DMT)-like permease